MSSVGEGPWWPIKSSKKGRKQKAYKREREREIRSSLFIFDLKEESCRIE